MRQYVRDSFPREEDGELFSPVAKGLAATADRKHLLCHHLQNLITNIMAIGIIELFEVIHIKHGNCIASANPVEVFIKRPARRYPGQVIPECHIVGVLQNAEGDYQPGGCAESSGYVRRVDF